MDQEMSEQTTAQAEVARKLAEVAEAEKKYDFAYAEAIYSVDPNSGR
jgi:hypothetical protein